MFPLPLPPPPPPPNTEMHTDAHFRARVRAQAGTHIHTPRSKACTNIDRGTSSAVVHKLNPLHFLFPILLPADTTNSLHVPLLLNCRLNPEGGIFSGVPPPTTPYQCDVPPHHGCLSSCEGSFPLGGISINLNCKGASASGEGESSVGRRETNAAGCLTGGHRIRRLTSSSRSDRK